MLSLFITAAAQARAIKSHFLLSEKKLYILNIFLFYFHVSFRFLCYLHQIYTCFWILLIAYNFIMPSGNKSFMPDDYDDDENESSIRRACSLSDLSMGKGKDFIFFLCVFATPTALFSKKWL